MCFSLLGIMKGAGLDRYCRFCKAHFIQLCISNAWNNRAQYCVYAGICLKLLTSSLLKSYWQIMTYLRFEGLTSGGLILSATLFLY